MFMRSFRQGMLMLCMLLSACGFHLRGQNDFDLPFETLYVKAANENGLFINELKSAIQANNVQLINTPEQAKLTLHIVSEVTGKDILSLSVAGTVLEYRLKYTISMRAFDQKQQEWLAPQEITLHRDYSYDSTQILAKQQEEAQLYQDMRSDAVKQVMRRLNHAHPQL